MSEQNVASGWVPVNYLRKSLFIINYLKVSNKT